MLDKKLKTQSIVCKKAIQLFLQKSLIEKHPADKVIANFLRKNKQLGSRDRRIIMETAFSVFRWWGWLKEILPKEIGDKFHHIPEQQKSLELPDHVITQVLLCATLLEINSTIPEIIVFYWARELGISWLPNIQDLPSEPVQRISKILKILDIKNLKDLELFDLIPYWIPNELPSKIDLIKLIKYFQERPPMWLRIQHNKPQELIIKLKEYFPNITVHPIINNAIAIDNPRINLYSLEEFKNGLFEVQDLASQAIGLSCNPKPGERWWDTCAGAGGKSLQLASLMKNKGKIWATDIREYKLQDLKKRARKPGFSNFMCSYWDGKPLPHKKRYNFDGVLVDVPCTCSGTWRRNPDARWSISQQDIAEISALQLKLLQSAASGVKHGGKLIYATCSIFEKENQGVVHNFLKNDNNFELEPFLNPLTNENTSGMLQILPWDGNCDATFIAHFKRKK